MPSPKVYGETAQADGKAAFDGYLGKEFALDQPGQGRLVGAVVAVVVTDSTCKVTTTGCIAGVFAHHRTE